MFFWNSLALFNDPVDVGNLISGSSAFSKSSLNIWKFMVNVLLKSDLENFEHYFASVWDERNCAVWAFFGIAFLGIGMKTDLSQSCGQELLFLTNSKWCWYYWFWEYTLITTSLQLWDPCISSFAAVDRMVVRTLVTVLQLRNSKYPHSVKRPVYYFPK